MRQASSAVGTGTDLHLAKFPQQCMKTDRRFQCTPRYVHHRTNLSLLPSKKIQMYNDSLILYGQQIAWTRTCWHLMNHQIQMYNDSLILYGQQIAWTRTC
ncbi:hypothetical protein CHS0354_004934, partial [Potamilus streckersoni]